MRLDDFNVSGIKTTNYEFGNSPLLVADSLI